MSDGTTVYQIIGLPAAASSWTQFTSTSSVPLGAQDMTVYHLIHTLTFDDGYVNQYTQTMPLLKKYGFTSTQFIITGDINTSGYLSTSQLKSLYSAGNEIASHTVTHNDMLTESSSQWITELSQSKKSLQQWTGASITDFAYPNGLYNQGILKDTAQYYTAARGVEDGLNSKDNFSIYDIKVQNVYSSTTTAQIADWVKQAQATKTWLVLVYHSVDPDVNNPVDSGIYNVTPTQLDAQLSAIKTSGISVATMQQALKTLTPQL